MAKSAAFTVTGPGIEAGYNDFGPALSRSITAATRRRDSTMYVRNAAGDVVGYSESDEHGNVIVVRHDRKGK